MRCCNPTLPTSKPTSPCLLPGDIVAQAAHRHTSRLEKGNVVSTHVAAYGLSSVRASYLEAI